MAKYENKLGDNEGPGTAQASTAQGDKDNIKARDEGNDRLKRMLTASATSQGQHQLKLKEGKPTTFSIDQRY
jgi:siroheme synthase